MKLLAADHTEHTITVELDNGLEQTFTGVHEDFVAEAQNELYGRSFNPQESQHRKPAKKQEAAPKPDENPVEFI